MSKCKYKSQVPCDRFEPQFWRKTRCKHCFYILERHYAELVDERGPSSPNKKPLPIVVVSNFKVADNNQNGNKRKESTPDAKPINKDRLSRNLTRREDSSKASPRSEIGSESKVKNMTEKQKSKSSFLSTVGNLLNIYSSKKETKSRSKSPSPERKRSTPTRSPKKGVKKNRISSLNKKLISTPDNDFAEVEVLARTKPIAPL